MNTAQLKKNVGQHVKLRPRVLQVRKSFIVSGELPHFLTSDSPRPQRTMPTIETDYLWTIESIDDKHVTLYCAHTNHTVPLEFDNVRECRSPNFLLLRCKLTLDGERVLIEPI